MDNLSYYIAHPERLNRDTLYELRLIVGKYPYFDVARLLMLKNLYLLHDITFGEELRRAAVYITDRRMLFSLVEGDRFSPKALEHHQPIADNPGVDRTLSLIDAFLSTLPEEPTAPAIINLPVEAASDYTSYLSSESVVSEVVSEEQPKLKGQELIDSFLENSEEQPLIASAVSQATEEDEAEKMEVEPAESDEESYFTETLAKIYVKQQRYSKALEIIHRLNLKYPKKNAYFADQIRFLEKLIINAKSK